MKVSEAQERRVEIITNALLHLPIEGRALELAARQIDMALSQAALSALPPDGEAVAAQCCVCGKSGLSTVEGDGGTECQLSDGRWTCSQDCYYTAVDWFPSPGNADRSEGVRVKALEWVVSEDGALMVSHTVAGRYAITIYRGMPMPAFLYAPDWPERKEYSGPDEAIAAAQAHFDATVRSCLSPPQTEEGDKRVVEARNEALREAASIASKFIDGRLYQPKFPACSYHVGEISAAILALRNKP